MKSCFVVLLVLACGLAWASEPVTEEHYDLTLGDKVWLRTVTTPFDPARAEATYKVFTHVMDFEGTVPITNGIDGKKYPHHRGLFIGWKDTMVKGVDYDTWHMSNCTQRHAAWLEQKPGADRASQVERVDWCDPEGKPFITETRTISAQPGKDGLRLIDFQSVLTSVAGKIALRGDLHHAGMQIRLADEVSRNEAATQYILPEGAKELKNDKVTGAWWVCCSAEVGGKRYWIVHMTPKTLGTEPPVYSIRRYARFGAFWEPVLAEGEPVRFDFRIVVSEKPLDRAVCEALYQEYTGTGKTGGA